MIVVYVLAAVWGTGIVGTFVWVGYVSLVRWRQRRHVAALARRWSR